MKDRRVARILPLQNRRRPRGLKLGRNRETLMLDLVEMVIRWSSLLSPIVHASLAIARSQRSRHRALNRPRTCARRSDNTDGFMGVASGRLAVGSALMLPHLFASEQPSPSARERVRQDNCPTPCRHPTSFRRTFSRSSRRVSPSEAMASPRSHRPNTHLRIGVTGRRSRPAAKSRGGGSLRNPPTKCSPIHLSMALHDDLGCTVSENRLPRKSSFNCLSTGFLSGTR